MADFNPERSGDRKIPLSDRLRDALAGTRSVADAKAALVQWGAAAERSEDFETRLLRLQLMERAGLGSAAEIDWERMYSEQPNHQVVARYKIISLRRKGDLVGARQAIDKLSDSAQRGTGFDHLKLRAELLDDIQEHDESFAIYRDLIARDKSDQRLRVAFAKRLVKVGRYKDVVDELDDLAPSLQQGSKSLELYDDARRKVDCLERLLAPDRRLTGCDCRLVALELLLARFQQRPVAAETNSNRVAMITGGLGAGGAERQLTKLTRLMVEVQESQPHEPTNEFRVIVRSHESSIKINDFFLPDLEAAGIAVHQIDQMTPQRADRQVELSEDEEILYSMLPAPVHYGVTRLAPFLRDESINVASIWQDGACLFAALAALFAGVDRIQPHILQVSR